MRTLSCILSMTVMEWGRNTTGIFGRHRKHTSMDLPDRMIWEEGLEVGV
jgi:hypothetical protein